jgi:hypothetical protein
MNRVTTILPAVLAGAMLAACSGGSEPPAAAAEKSATTEVPASEAPASEAPASEAAVAVLTPEDKYSVVGKPQGPVRIDYRIIGTPVVGQPVTIALNVKSNVGDTPVELSYGTNDSTAMTFPASQKRRVMLAFLDEERTASQQVTVVPAREGRLFLNVTAHMQTDTGSLQTVTAVPIQVGGGPRELQENGVVTTDEDGELIREMPASEN